MIGTLGKRLLRVGFYTFLFFLFTPVAYAKNVEIVVEEELEPSISLALENYCSDLVASGYTPTIYAYNSLTGSPGALKSYLQTRWVSGNLDGTVFVGDLPIATYEMNNDFYGYSSFPSDLFYMDLDGNWLDSDGNGLFDTHISGGGDVSPDIWFGRITTSTLGDEAQLINDYFQKNHDYRAGNLTFNNEALVYIDDDWYDWADSWNDDVQMAYPGATELVKEKDTTNADDYRNQLQNGNYESMLQAIHSNYYYLAFKDENLPLSYVNYDEIPVLNPQIGFYNFFDCSFANFTEFYYMAGRYIFDTDYGLAGIGSTKIGSMLNFDDFYGVLRDSAMGEAFLSWFSTQGADGYQLWEKQWFYGMTYLGDPTLGLGGMAAPYNPVIPEPGTWFLLSSGLLGLAAFGRKKRLMVAS